VSEAIQLADRMAVMTARPGQIADIVDVPLPRPRATDLMGDPTAAKIEARIRRVLAAAHPVELEPWSAGARG
jgi:NitT/TauT family transport system ATP-binding protein